MGKWIAALIGLLVLYQCWDSRSAVTPAAGVLAAEAPKQTTVGGGDAVGIDDFVVMKLARFEVTARVLGRADYWFDDGAALSNTDLALGWGRMSDSTVLDALEISQSNRWYRYSWADAPPIPADEITRSSANMHFIAANPQAGRMLKRVREGQVIHFVGHLVEATRSNGWHWTSSLTRDDSGDGACELVLLESLEIR